MESHKRTWIGAIIALILLVVLGGLIYYENKVGADTVKKDGLEISIFPDKSTVRYNGTVTYTVSVKNLSNKSGRFFVHMTPDFNKTLNSASIPTKSDWTVYSLLPGQTSTMEVPIKIASDKILDIRSVVQVYYETNGIKTYIANADCLVSVNPVNSTKGEGYLKKGGGNGGAYYLVNEKDETVLSGLVTLNSETIYKDLERFQATYVLIEGHRVKTGTGDDVIVVTKVTPKIVSYEGILTGTSTSKFMLDLAQNKTVQALAYKNGSKDVVDSVRNNYSALEHYVLKVSGYKLFNEGGPAYAILDVTKVEKVEADTAEGYNQGGSAGTYPLLAADGQTVVKNAVNDTSDEALGKSLHDQMTKFKDTLVRVGGYKYYPEKYDYFNSAKDYSISMTEVAPQTATYQGTVTSCSTSSFTLTQDDNKQVRVIVINGSRDLITQACAYKNQGPVVVSATGYKMLDIDVNYFATIDITGMVKVTL